MKLSLNLGRIAGTRLSIHWSFLILLGWAFFSFYAETKSLASGAWGVAFVLVVFVCVVLHEFGHILTAKRYGIKTSSITLLPIGGMANMDRMPEKPGQELRVALAGPMVNLMIGGLIFLGFTLAGRSPDFENIGKNFTASGFISQILAANLALAIFNLVPAFPMDGGRVFRALLGYFMPRHRATNIAARVGQFIAVGFMILGLYGNFMLIFIGLFIFFAAGMEAGLEESKSTLSGYKVKHAVMKRYATLHPEDTLAHAAQRLLENSDKNFVVMDKGDITGIISRSDILHGITDLGKNASVAKAMQRDYPVLFADMPLEDAYEKLISSAVTFAPVVDDSNFFGVIDLDNINELLMIEKASRETRRTREKSSNNGITQRYLHI